MANVTVIPATRNFHTGIRKDAVVQKKTAGYARVSTDSEEQQTSYEAQVDYYTNYIKNNPEWEFVGVYTDEGISATGTKHRDGFNQMIQDALDGKIDLIVTKSVSRFARNTVDSLTTVRLLKANGIGVYFEKENIYTFDGKGELLLTIMSSLAQEESRSISENVTWGQRKRFADGKVSIAYSSFLGYQKGEDGQMEIVPEEAEIVRLIYRMFMQGKTPYAIAKYLMEKKIPTPTGKQRWQHRTIENILTNEKYKGDARLQKCYTVDFLSKKRKVNEGEVPQYYVEGSHDAIIAPAEWQMVQLEMERRRNMGRSHNCCGPFSAKLKCGDCGEFFGSKVWHSNSKYKRTIWQCNAKFKGESKCTTPHLYEQRIQELFLEALGRLLENRETVIDDCRAVMDVLGDCSSIEKELETVSGEMEVVTGLIQKLVVENATRKLDQNDYRRKYEGYVNKYAALESRMDSLKKDRESREIKFDIFSGFLFELSELEELPLEFDVKLFHSLVDYATVYHDGRIVFQFRNGMDRNNNIKGDGCPGIQCGDAGSGAYFR